MDVILAVVVVAKDRPLECDAIVMDELHPANALGGARAMLGRALDPAPHIKPAVLVPSSDVLFLFFYQTYAVCNIPEAINFSILARTVGSLMASLAAFGLSLKSCNICRMIGSCKIF